MTHAGFVFIGIILGGVVGYFIGKYRTMNKYNIKK